MRGWRDGRRKTMITNHRTTSPTKWPVFRFIPARRRKWSAPTEAKRLSIFRLWKTCSMALEIKEPKNQPIMKNTIAKMSFGVNCTKLHHRLWRD